MGVGEIFGCIDDVDESRVLDTPLGTNISPFKGTFESMMFLFPRWDMLVPRRVNYKSLVKLLNSPRDRWFNQGLFELLSPQPLNV